MRLSHIETLALVLGSGIIIGSMALSLPAGGSPETVELIAQLLLLVVLFAAVRYGRRGGLTAATVAAAAYVLMRVPTLEAGGMSAHVALVIASRLAAFALVGIVGGEATMRAKYLLADLEQKGETDEWSRMFNQRHAVRALTQALGRSERYGEPFSVVLITLSPSLFSGFTPARQRSVIRGLAEHLSSDLRMVDEVSRLSDGRFLVLLPHTPKAGGDVVGQRLGSLVRTKLGAQDRSVSWQVLGAPEDTDGIKTLLDALGVGEAPQGA